MAGMLVGYLDHWKIKFYQLINQSLLLLLIVCWISLTGSLGGHREDVEELQHLWAEVRRQVMETEQLLTSRMKAVAGGNDNFSSLTSISILQRVSSFTWFTHLAASVYLGFLSRCSSLHPCKKKLCLMYDLCQCICSVDRTHTSVWWRN